MTTPKDLIFDPSKGINNSPLQANAFSSFVDITITDGVAISGFKSTNIPIDSGESEILEKIKKFEGNYAIDTNGHLWSIGEGGFSRDYWTLRSAGTGSGEGMIQYNGLLYLFRESEIDTFNLTSYAVVSGWQSDPATFGVVSSDNFLYLAYNNIVRSFDGTDYTAEALDIPEDEVINTLVDLGRFLAIGTDSGRVYLWDKTITTFELPSQLQSSIEMLIPFKNFAYIVTKRGDIYVTNGSSTELVLDFPRNILGDKNSDTFSFEPNGWRVEGNDIYIGYGSTSSSVYPTGIYKYNVRTGDFNLFHKPSDDDETGLNGFVLQQSQTRTFYFYSYNSSGSSAATGLIDKQDSASRYPSCEIRSQLYKVAMDDSKRAFKKAEISLAEPLVSGQSVELYYRESLQGAWTLIGTMNTVGEVSDVLRKTILVGTIQLKTIQKTGGNTPVNLMLVTLR